MATNIAANADRLREIRSFPSLVKYLREELDWPVESDDFEELTFEWSPEDLGIDPNNAAKIEQIKQLRPLITGQPWGIFFIKFEPKRLPVVALRRLLNQLVVKKRAASNRSERQLWKMHDLLFISSYGEGDERHITFAHFSEPTGATSSSVPTLRVLGWDGEDTFIKLDVVAQTLVSRLAWPTGAVDIDSWRSRWADAFMLRPGEVIQTSIDLATRLADLARGVRGRGLQILRVEGERGKLRKLYTAFKQALISDLTEADFADMYAQTVAYGLFSGIAAQAVTAEKHRGVYSHEIAHGLGLLSPFLREMLSTFLNATGKRGDADFDELGIQDISDLLNSPNTHIEAIIADFRKARKEDDPVLYFYELFLHKYDSQRRVERGVFYTPQAVVKYIVSQVHKTLKTQFAIVDGLASTITWQEWANKRNYKKGVPPQLRNQFVVQILDPALGTGTFLVEAIGVIFEEMTNKWTAEGLSDDQRARKWDQYVKRYLLPRLVGFELMMAPYAIAQMKLGLALAETGYTFTGDEQARVYLTNTLEPPIGHSGQRSLEAFAPAIAHEAERAAAAKQHYVPSVIVGNPPYSNFGSLNRNDWILSQLARYKSELNERKLNLDDDYIKFFCYAHARLDGSPIALLGYISNSSYLDGVTHRQMRRALRNSFPNLTEIVNLHGNVRRKDKSPDGSIDENVFDIQQGVAISIFGRSDDEVQRKAVKYSDLWGKRDEKLQRLASGQVVFREFQPEEYDPNLCLFIPKDSTGADEYRSWPSLTQVFAGIGQGIQTKQDDFCIAFDKKDILERVADLKALRARALIEKYDVPERTASWSLHDAVRDVKSNSGHVMPLGLRPFDVRWTYFTGHTNGFHARPRSDSTGNMVSLDNIALIAKRQTKEADFSSMWVSRCPINEGYFSIDPRGRETLFPLYISSERNHGAHTASLAFGVAQCNINRRLFAKTLERLSDLELFCLLYAILNSAAYRTRYGAFLQEDFPHVPCHASRELAVELSKLGSSLVELHAPRAPSEVKPNAAFRVGTFEGKQLALSHIGVVGRSVGKAFPTFERPHTIHISESGMVFNVPESVWAFMAGGYPICHKWLKDRRGMKLSLVDAFEYCRMLDSIASSLKVVADIDATIEKYGGWPAAFGANE